MVFQELLSALDREPVFETGFLLAGDVDPKYIRRQLVEWVKTGKLWQLRRGLYAPAPPYQKTAPHPFLIANRIVTGSYISLQTALGYYGLIPEHVAAITSVGPSRPGEWRNPAGLFTYRHMRNELMFGYDLIDLGNQHSAFVAHPEKALLDLVYLIPGGQSWPYLESLRLQNLDTLDLETMSAYIERAGKPKLHKVLPIIAALAVEESSYESI